MVSTVTPFSDMDPSPRVVVFVDAFDLNGSTTKITVFQVSAAGEFPVRNAIRRVSAGGFVVTDFEVPLGIPVTYRVQQFNSAGKSLGYVLSLHTQVDIEVGFAVLSDPLNPAHAVLVSANPDFGGVLKRPRPVQTYRAGVNTVALMGLEGLLESVPLHCETESLIDADMLELVLAETQFLVRVQASTVRIPAVMHVVAGEPTQKPVSVQFGGELISWEMTGDQVSRTTLDILFPLINYQRFADAYATYASAAAAYATYLAALLAPPPEV